MSVILITGINGFIGSNIAKRFISDGHKVRGLVRKTSDLSFIDGMNIELFYGDITSTDTLSVPVKGADIVIHAAGFASDWGSYEKFYRINVEGTQNIARASCQGGVKRFVHISTTAAYGFSGFQYMEESEPMADTIFAYCETKKIAEKWLFELAKSSEMEIVAIRPGNVFGPNDHTFIEKYADALTAGKGGYIGGGRTWTAPTYVENLVDGIVLACFKKEAAGEAFFITDGLEIDWRTFTEKLCIELGIKPPILSIPFRVGYIIAYLMEIIYKLFQIKKDPLLTRYRISNGGRDYHFSIKKAAVLLGYSPKVTLEDSVKRTAQWYKGSRGLRPLAGL
ncbi:MAG: NAD-dependent epimerase/dehydratase family protein [Nitrospirae bacterium]|nr:NAD-dependent epimerase/dehydratase family protein [Nitrospirota bacterium]MBF0542051.1 NAD-dependent epimerase/dehydratase family protein [Nitrospirota bacterium]